jgi:hypothetical protein
MPVAPAVFRSSMPNRGAKWPQLCQLIAALASRRDGRSDQRSRRNRCPDTPAEASAEARPAAPRSLRPRKNWRFACARQACWRNIAKFAAVQRRSASVALRFAQSGPPHRLCSAPSQRPSLAAAWMANKEPRRRARLWMRAIAVVTLNGLLRRWRVTPELSADTDLAGDLEDALTGTQSSLDTFFRFFARH